MEPRSKAAFNCPNGRLGAVLFFLGLRPGSVLNDARRGCAPSSALLPMRRALRPSKGDGVRLCLTLLPDEKVTKESPRGVPPLSTPLGGHYHPPSNASVAPPERGATPGSTQKPNPPAAPRISSRKCFSGKALGENKARLPTQLKVANRSRLVAETLSRGCGLPQGERSVPLWGFRGLAS